MIGGSPCTHWSIAQTKDRETKPEGIGWELFLNYRIARDKYQPDFFLYENNKSMSSAIRAQITKELGVEPVLINSALVSAQSRQRLYWCGRREPDGTYSQVHIEQPEDRGILLRDILETGTAWREKAYTLKANYGKASAAQYFDGGHYPAAAAAEPARIGTIENKAKNPDHDSKQYRVYSPDGKATTLCGEGGGVGAKTGLYATPVGPDDIRCVAQRGRYIGENGSVAQHFEAREDGKTNALTTVQKDNLVAVPAGIARRGRDGGSNLEMRNDQKSNAVSASGHQSRLVIEAAPDMRVQEATKQGYVDIKPGECVDMAMPKSKTRRGRAMREKANCLTTSCDFYEYCGTLNKPIYEVRDGKICVMVNQKGEIERVEKWFPIKLKDGFYIIRKLTVRECMRLQTVPESYVFPASPTQAYKMLGNGWTVDVIAHLLSHFEGLTAGPVEVLSMYDGMSCGHIALDKLGVQISRYFATEIDKYAIETTLCNYPDTVQMGDAFQVREDGWRIP